MNHEEELVKAFILPARQERYLEFLKTPKNRAKFIDQLAHFKHLNTQLAFSIRGNQRNPASLLKLLTGKGAGPNCWVMSENSDMDGRELDLETALKETVGRQMGALRWRGACQRLRDRRSRNLVWPSLATSAAR